MALTIQQIQRELERRKRKKLKPSLGDTIKKCFKKAAVPNDDRHKYLYQILIDEITLNHGK